MKNSSSKNIAGIVLIILGGLWFLSTTHIAYFDVWDYFWPSLFLTIGIVMAVRGKALVIATLLIFFGGINLASQVFDYNFDYLFSDYWPLILITLGLLILFKKRDPNKRCHDRHNKYNYDNSCANPFYEAKTENTTLPAEEPQAESSSSSSSSSSADSFTSSAGTSFHSDYFNPLDIDQIDEVAILTSSRKYITSKNFKGGRVTAVLGAAILDFTGAKLAEGENSIEVTAIMGGVTLKVPQDWKVIVNVHSIFGGVEDKRRYFSPVEPIENATLVVRGTVLMGGATITY